MRSERLQTAASLMLVFVSVVMAVVLVHREFFASTALSSNRGRNPTKFDSNWRDIARQGVPSGDTSATIQLVVFSDLECPVCRNFEKTRAEFAKRHPTDVVTYFVHFPLPSIHRFALPAARAAECANAEHRFNQLTALFYAKQDSLGLKAWASFAKEAGIHDSLQFSRCISDTMPMRRIEAGLSAARRVKAPGTPTVVINGWQLGDQPDIDELERIRAALIAGKRPFTSVDEK